MHNLYISDVKLSAKPQWEPLILQNYNKGSGILAIWSDTYGEFLWMKISKNFNENSYQIAFIQLVFCWNITLL